MENLAPAGNREALERAEAAGADAVYLGYSAFSARAGAGNFNRQELEEAIRFAHFHHMRVYVTVNTLVKDRELAEVTEVLKLLRDLHADGVLIQDAGIVRIAQILCPGLAIHASTQMAIHNRTGVEFCAREGMKRVVLARECSLEEIRKCTEPGPEIEVFGHGAQCVSVSGMCLFSSMVGERSGNRGRCAQPCRLEYTFKGRRGAWLSPRDVCLRRDIKTLKAAGVASLKLEGRLKRPEYVAVVTGAYRRGIDGTEQPGADLRIEEDMTELKQIFNRGGFMRGYAMGCRDAEVICTEKVDHEGLEIGYVESVNRGFARVRVSRTLHDGDGLQFRNGRDQFDMIYSGKNTEQGGTALVRLREDMRVHPGDNVARLTDAEQMEKARKLPSHEVRMKMLLTAYPGKKLTLTVTDGGSSVTLEGDEVSPARNREATEDELRKNLCKTGGTGFIPEEITVRTKGAFVPVSAVNNLRREALEQLYEARIRDFEPDNQAEGILPSGPEGGRQAPHLILCGTVEQVEAAWPYDGLKVYRPEDYRDESLRRDLDLLPDGTWLDLPPVCEEDGLRGILAIVTEYRDKLGGVLLESLGQLGIRWPVPTGSGIGIPVMNRQAAAFLFERGCAFMTASPELSGSELAELTECRLPLVTPARGRIQLMLLHHCPARTFLGLSKGRENCVLCDREDRQSLKGECLTDRRGYSFPLERLRLPEGCLVRVLNMLPLDLLDRTDHMPVWVSFEEESSEKVREVLNARDAGERVGDESTAGHWNRPVD